MPRIPGYPIEACSQRGVIIVKDRCHAPGVEIAVLANDGRTVRAGTANSGSSAYFAKAKAFAFGGLSPDKYEIVTTLNGVRVSLSVFVTAGGVHESVLKIAHGFPYDINEQILKRIKCEPTIFPHNTPAFAEPIPSGSGIGATARYLMHLEPSTRKSKRGKRKIKRSAIAVWKDHSKLSRYDLPVEELIAREREYLSTHIAVYTGMRFDFLLLQYFSSELLRVLIPDQPQLAEMCWLRHPFDDQPAKYRWGDIRDFVKSRQLQYPGGRAVIDDNSPEQAWFLLSCNPHLFGNTLTDAMESTVDYYYDSIGVINIDIFEKIAEILDSAGLLPNDCLTCKEKRRSIFQAMSDALEAIRPSTKPGGVLLQILLPQKIVNEVAYITRTNDGSFTNGTPASEHLNCLETLLRIRDASYPVDKIDNYATLQVRILTSRLIEPNSGVIIHEVMMPSDAAKNQFRGKMAALAQDILDFHTLQSFKHCI